jgi:glycerol-3-phosphate cytidylyltransferase-like family protein
MVSQVTENKDVKMLKIDFVVHGDGSGKDFKVDCSSSDSNEYTIEEIFNGKLSLITSY